MITIEKKIFIILISIFFPINIVIFGKDSMTTGTITIILLFIVYIIEGYRRRKIIYDRLDNFVILLIFLAIISVAVPYLEGSLTTESIGPAVRLSVGYISSLLLFFVVKNWIKQEYFLKSSLYREKVENFLSVLLILICAHIFISLMVMLLPGFGVIFNVFLGRESHALEMYESAEGLVRIRSFVFKAEAYGEILGAMSPILAYKLYNYFKLRWVAVVLIISIGIMYTATRSGIILYFFGWTISLLYMCRFRPLFTYTISLISTMLFFLLYYFRPLNTDDVLFRFHKAGEVYNEGGSIVEILNRDNVFYPALELIYENLSLFGSGSTPFNFHNLYMTVLYQRGIIGSLVFFSIIFYLLFRLLKASSFKLREFEKSIVFCCFLSLFLFLVNETKFEFVRHSSYQQIWWFIFAIYYCISSKEFFTQT